MSTNHVHTIVYSPQPSIPQLEYAPTAYQQQQPEFSQPDSGLVVPVFQKGDDPIDAINHMMSFLTAVVTSRYPTTNNQLRTSLKTLVNKLPSLRKVKYATCSGETNYLCTGTMRNTHLVQVEATRGNTDCHLLQCKEEIALMANLSEECSVALTECLELKTELLNKKDFVAKETYDKLSFKGNVDDSNIKMDMDEIETLNIELEHRVTKLVAENEHLKQTYKQLYDSIKPKRVQSKEQCDALIKQVNIKSGEISDLNAKLQEQGLVIAALKNELRKLKGKALDNEDTVTHSVVPKVSKDDMEPITPKLLNKRTAHSSYIKHTQEEALVLRDIVEHVKANYPQDPLLESAFRYTKVIQDLLSHISRSCPSINNCGPQLIEVIPRKKDKKVRFAESLTSTENTKPASTSNIVSNKHVLHSTGVRLSTSASGSQPSGNTKNDRILQPPSSNSKNKVEAHPRNVKTSLNKKNSAK
ncbi:hypothetical protein Tco_0343740 [Tanacetum coccineum]